MKKIPFFSPIIEKMIEKISMKKFNLTKIEDLSNKVTINTSSLIVRGLDIATNDDSSVFRLYGLIQANVVRQKITNDIIITIQTSLKPKKEMIIPNAVLMFLQSGYLLDGYAHATQNEVQHYPFYGNAVIDLIIKTNGQVIITIPSSWVQTGVVQSVPLYLPPTTYFLD